MQQFRALCQRYAGWIVVLLVLLLCQRWWIARNKPERLLELPPGASLRSLHKGILTLEKWTTPSLQFNTTHIRRPGSNRLIPITTTTTQTPATLALFTMPATGGPLHSLPPESSAETSNSLFTAGSDTYRVEYHKTMRELIGIPPGYGSRSGSSGTGIGSSGPPPPPKPPFHPVTNREEAEEVTATLHRVSASGVPTTEALTCPMGYVAKSHISSSPGLRTFLEPKITVAGNAVYWIKGFPNELTYHRVFKRAGRRQNHLQVSKRRDGNASAWRQGAKTAGQHAGGCHAACLRGWRSLPDKQRTPFGVAAYTSQWYLAAGITLTSSPILTMILKIFWWAVTTCTGHNPTRDPMMLKLCRRMAMAASNAFFTQLPILPQLRCGSGVNKSIFALWMLLRPANRHRYTSPRSIASIWHSLPVWSVCVRCQTTRIKCCSMRITPTFLRRRKRLVL